MIRGRPQLAIAIEVPTREKPGIAFARGSADLCGAVDAAIGTLRGNGIFAQLAARWLAAQGER